ncbi:DUF2274 domain-containing protein [Eleftheria terrae]|uniref:DUF2274 domain-containing protein n=1 Tax=Eleftheria terrae TaxID=1597781 RepID=UPI00263A5842|nr:DUF2274 domain-containing protein [Eleftheria terrae]WKB50515.1 DUF2274 domain-containing protein [Eleftheria terrae]
MPRRSAAPVDLVLAKVPKPPQYETVKFKLPKPLLNCLEDYRSCYKDIRQEEIEIDALLALILEGHFERDRAFADWLKKNGKSLAR